MEIEEYFFNCDMLENQHIFKIPDMLKKTDFVSDIFVQTVQENALKGFIFRETGVTLSK